MIFSTDLTKPLSRVGLAINLVLLTALFYVVSAASYHYMTETLPHQGAAHQTAELAAQTAEKTFEKAKKAAKEEEKAVKKAVKPAKKGAKRR